MIHISGFFSVYHYIAHHIAVWLHSQRFLRKPKTLTFRQLSFIQSDWAPPMVFWFCALCWAPPQSQTWKGLLIAFLHQMTCGYWWILTLSGFYTPFICGGRLCSRELGVFLQSNISPLRPTSLTPGLCLSLCKWPAFRGLQTSLCLFLTPTLKNTYIWVSAYQWMYPGYYIFFFLHTFALGQYVWLLLSTVRMGLIRLTSHVQCLEGYCPCCSHLGRAILLVGTGQRNCCALFWLSWIYYA